MSYWGDRKPPFGTAIDWSHPLARGLVGHWLLAENGGPWLFSSALGPRLAAGGTGTPTWNQGLSTTSQGQCAYATAGPLLQLSPPMTIVLQGRATAGATNCSWFGATYQSLPDASPYWGYMLGTNNTHSAVDFTWNHGGTGGSSNGTGTTPVLTAGVRTQVVGRIRRNGGNGNVQLWKDAVQLTNQDVTAFGTINYGSGALVGFGDMTNFTASNFVSDFGAIYGYDLGDNLLRWLNAEPYAMFAPPSRAPRLLARRQTAAAQPAALLPAM